MLRILISLLVTIGITSCSLNSSASSSEVSTEVPKSEYSLTMNFVPVSIDVDFTEEKLRSITLITNNGTTHFPSNSFSDIEGVNKDYYQLHRYSDHLGLSLMSGDGAEVFNHYFTIRDNRVISRSRSWIGPDSQGRHMKTYSDKLTL